jgi:hypothetical protein
VKPDGLAVQFEPPDAGRRRLDGRDEHVLERLQGRAAIALLHGAGMFCVTAHVQPGDGPALDKFLLEKDGTCTVELSGTAIEPHLEFAAKDGTPISRVALQRVDETRYTARCTIPAAPYRVAITGRDLRGKEFRRTERRLRP